MDKDDEKTIDDLNVEDLVEAKKSKKSSSESKENEGLQGSEPSQESISLEDVGSSEPDTESKPEFPSDTPDEAESEPVAAETEEDETKPVKKSINLDGLEEESFLDEAKQETSQEPIAEKQPLAVELAEKSNDAQTTADEKPDANEGKKETATEAADADNTGIEDYDEDFEDTQKDKYLTFRIGDESFGFAIKYVTEIIVIHKITEVPDTPAFVRGVINLRGKVIPVIDVRHRFNMELREYDERTCIIVMEYEETSVGLIVDTVNEVADIPEDHIDPPPRTHSGIESSYILGMGKIGKEVNILLNLEKVLFVDEILAKRRILEES
jgi:purine-binding chemotaxis protein CheW